MYSVLDKTADYIYVVSEPSRFKIIDSLQNTQFTLSELAKHCGMSVQNTKNHLKMLEGYFIVEKSDHEFALTSLGFAALKQLESVEFLQNYAGYFQGHGFGDSPYWFLNCLGMLKNSELVCGFTPSLARWRKTIKDARKYVLCMLAVPPINIADDINSKVKSGCEIRMIFGKNTKIPDNNEFVNSLNLKELTSIDLIKKKICNSVHINMVMSDSSACLMFPDFSVGYDLHNTLVSSDNNFHKWCKDFFDYKWEDGESFARFRN